MPQTQYMLPYMVQNNWLYNYQFINGISDTLNGMNRRTKGKSRMHLAIRGLMAHYDTFEFDFKLVFKDLMLVSKYFFGILTDITPYIFISSHGDIGSIDWGIFRHH